MERAYSKDGDDGDRPLRKPAAAMTTARHQTMPGQTQAAKMEDARHLDLKALRLAVHGWWLGNPLVYKPGTADLNAVARELAGAGAASGTLVLSEIPADGDGDSDGIDTTLGAKTIPHISIYAILILRPTVPRSLLGSAAAQAVAEVAQAALGCPCTVQQQWEVVLRDDPTAQRFCRVSVNTYEDAALVKLRLMLGQLRTAAEDEAGQPAMPPFARPDWREVFLARVLHALDGRLRTMRIP